MGRRNKMIKQYGVYALENMRARYLSDLQIIAEWASQEMLLSPMSSQEKDLWRKKEHTPSLDLAQYTQLQATILHGKIREIPWHQGRSPGAGVPRPGTMSWGPCPSCLPHPMARVSWVGLPHPLPQLYPSWASQFSTGFLREAFLPLPRVLSLEVEEFLSF